MILGKLSEVPIGTEDSLKEEVEFFFGFFTKRPIAIVVRSFILFGYNLALHFYFADFCERVDLGKVGKVNPSASYTLRTLVKGTKF